MSTDKEFDDFQARVSEKMQGASTEFLNGTYAAVGAMGETLLEITKTTENPLQILRTFIETMQVVHTSVRTELVERELQKLLNPDG